MSSEQIRPLLVLINPASGTKIATKMFKNLLQPSLEKEGIAYEVTMTQYAGHAKDIVQKTNLKEYSGLVIISGDGLLHEVFNGLYALPDWTSVMGGTSIGIMPGGSGNALNCSLLRQMEQPFDGINGLGTNGSLANIISGTRFKRTTGLDFIEVETDGKKLLSFLGVTIGLIADVDLGTEFLRFLGYMRAYVAAVYRILFPKLYFVKVSYLPLPKDENGKPIPVSSNSTPITLPSLNEPVPNDWVCEEGQYLCVYATNCSLLDPITLFAPESKVDDGVIWLITITSSLPRKEMVQWVLDTQNAGHVGKTGVRLIPVRAFRFEPVWPHGYLSIDAESYKFGPVQGQVLPKKANLFSVR